MPVEFNDEELKKAAARMTKDDERIREGMIKGILFSASGTYIPFESTATMASNITRRPLTFRPLPRPFEVIPNPYLVRTEKRSRERKSGFWRRLWEGLTDLNPWPYSPIECYELEVPSIIIDRQNNLIICHPSLEGEIKKAVREGKYDPAKR